MGTSHHHELANHLSSVGQPKMSHVTTNMDPSLRKFAIKCNLSLSSLSLKPSLDYKILSRFFGHYHGSQILGGSKEHQSCGLVVRVSALQLGDRGSIPGRVRPKTVKSGTRCLPA